MIDTLPQGFSRIQEGDNKVVGYMPEESSIVLGYVKRNEGHQSRYERFGQTYCDLVKATHDLACAIFPGEFVEWLGASALTDNPLFSAIIQMHRIELSEGQADSRRPTTPDGHRHRDLFVRAQTEGTIDRIITKWDQSGFTIRDISAHNFNFGTDGKIQYVDEIRPYEYNEKNELFWAIDENKCRQYIENHLVDTQKGTALHALNIWLEAKRKFIKNKHKKD